MKRLSYLTPGVTPYTWNPPGDAPDIVLWGLYSVLTKEALDMLFRESDSVLKLIISRLHIFSSLKSILSLLHFALFCKELWSHSTQLPSCASLLLFLGLLRVLGDGDLSHDMARILLPLSSFLQSFKLQCLAGYRDKSLMPLLYSFYFMYKQCKLVLCPVIQHLLEILKFILIFSLKWKKKPSTLSNVDNVKFKSVSCLNVMSFVHEVIYSLLPVSIRFVDCKRKNY